MSAVERARDCAEAERSQRSGAINCTQACAMASSICPLGRSRPLSGNCNNRPCATAIICGQTFQASSCAWSAGQDHLGITLQHRLEADLRRRQLQVVKHIARPAHRQRIADDLPATNGVQRLVPHLVKHPQRHVAPITLTQPGQTLTQLRGQLVGHASARSNCCRNGST